MQIHITIENGEDLPLNLLHQATGLPKQRIKLAMRCGAVWMTRGRNTQRLRRAKRTLKVGDEIHLYYDEKVLSEAPAAPQLVADRGEYSVWNKPYGLRSQGSKWGDHCTVYRWAERHLQPQRSAFIVHRLDRAARGLILLAHSKQMAAQLSQRFRERRIEKYYLAEVHGDASGITDTLRVDNKLDDREAVSQISFRELTEDGARSVLDVRLETGRKHQIRRHLSSIAYPIVGDRLYGRGAEDDVDLQLVAYRLRFVCPLDGVHVEYCLTPKLQQGKE